VQGTSRAIVNADHFNVRHSEMRLRALFEPVFPIDIWHPLLGAVVGMVASPILIIGGLVESKPKYIYWGIGIFAWCLYCIYIGAGKDRREVRELVAKLKALEKLDYEAAARGLEEHAVPVPRELAEIRRFSSPPANGARYRYLEKEEVVFRLEENGMGSSRIVPQDRYCD
jgi:hypothetical protein